MPMDTDFLVHRKRLRSGIGLSNASKYANSGHPLDNMLNSTIERGVPAISGRFEFAMDPAYYPGPPQAGNSGGFTLTEIAAGAANIFGVNVANGGVGWQIRTDNAASDSEVLQLNGTPYRYTLGKSFAFLAGFQLNDANPQWHIGMNIPDTSPIVSTPTDGIFFFRNIGSTPQLQVRKAGVSTTIPNVGATPAINTDGYFAFTVSEAGRIDAFAGPNPFALTNYGSVAPGNANIPNTTDLGLHIAITANAVASLIMLLKACVFGGDI